MSKRAHHKAAESIAKAMQALSDVPHNDALCMGGIDILFADMQTIFRSLDGWYERQMELAAEADEGAD